MSAQSNKTVENGTDVPEVPEYDAEAVGRVAARVEILNVELLGAFFDRSDNAVIAEVALPEATPEIGVNVEWNVAEDTTLLGCILSFVTLFDDEEDPPYRVGAGFRVLYEVKGDDPLSSEDANQFAHWNALFNAWPYWREFLTSITNRAQLPQFVAPVMRMPRTAEQDQ